MAKNINLEPFDDSTKLKLDIFGQCFKEWLPVFTNNRFTNKIYIFDFFAGSGKDSNNYPGSPLILLNTAKGEESKNCKKINKEINFIFNEASRNKAKTLKSNVEDFFYNCMNDNLCSECSFDYQINDSTFEEIFNNTDTQWILKNNGFGKFILLDQYGFKEINQEVFKSLIEYPKTDFIFFISTSFIKRFKEHPNTKKYFDTSKIQFEDGKPTHIHRAIANYYRSLIPSSKEYYIHHFTIQQKNNLGNYYGLIFGSNHTYGMEKFLKVCWSIDKSSGEANFNLLNDFGKETLFYNPNETVKKTEVKQIIENEILSGRIRDNLSGLKFSLKCGCEPKLFTEVVKNLERNGKINRTGDLNYNSTNIHKTKRYLINLVI